MKRVLLDENLPHSLRHHLDHHETMTAAYAGLAGLKNGDLLAAAEKDGFDLLVTGDRTLQYEQKLSGRRIAIVTLSAVEFPVIEPYLVEIVVAVGNAEPGSFTAVDCGQFSRRKPRQEGPMPG